MKEKVFTFFLETSGFKTIYDVAKFTQRLNELYGGEIEQQKCMKLFIDSQFKDTRRVILRLFAFYFFTFAMPFTLQMFTSIPEVIYFTNFLCLFC